ncbi:hypothetical protein BC830DRAFT_889015 [Chytriomyces sp. MP71]|nr:hypothetical protein BC830DRAFT_889015 [Chytriomyces sp. MP71]
MTNEVHSGYVVNETNLSSTSPRTSLAGIIHEDKLEEAALTGGAALIAGGAAVAAAEHGRKKHIIKITKATGGETLVAGSTSTTPVANEGSHQESNAFIAGAAIADGVALAGGAGTAEEHKKKRVVKITKTDHSAQPALPREHEQATVVEELAIAAGGAAVVAGAVAIADSGQKKRVVRITKESHVSGELLICLDRIECLLSHMDARLPRQLNQQGLARRPLRVIYFKHLFANNSHFA